MENTNNGHVHQPIPTDKQWNCRPDRGLVGMAGEKGLEAIDINRGSNSEQIRMVMDGL